MEQRILNHLRLKDYVPANVAALLKALRLKPAQRSKIEAVLRTLERSGQITRIKGRRYVLPRDADLVAGRIQRTSDAFVNGGAFSEGEVLIKIEDAPYRAAAASARARSGVRTV